MSSSLVGVETIPDPSKSADLNNTGLNELPATLVCELHAERFEQM